MRRRSRQRPTTEADINITAFMNLMVVLVPFLLITAVFSQISILELNLPATTQEAAPPEEEEKKPLVLEVLVYTDRLEVVDRQTGPLKIIENLGPEHDFDGMVDFLKQVKTKFPDVNDISILLESDTPYDLLVTTMDKVRIAQQMVAGESVKAELFPNIAIGDAPPDSRKAAVGGAQ